MSRLEATDSDAGYAAFTLVGLVIGKLVQDGILPPDQARAIAAMGAAICAGNGRDAAAALVATTYDVSSNEDIASLSARYGIDFERTVPS